ncbi:MAG: Rne/Rng family ribonuclease [Thermodesulfobacteriota bacterium]
MRNQILINTTFNETRVALIEDKLLTEIYVERDLNPQIVGNIYKGKVEKIVPGMQAAFVDIGSGKSGFISVEDVYSESFYEYISEDEKSDLKASNNYLIQEKLVQGQDIIVQVVKEPVQAKGPKLTSYISIPGKCLVLIPSLNLVGISHKIDDEKERNRLIDIINGRKPENTGFIARTLSEGISEKDLIKEIKKLTKMWEKILKSYEKKKKPNLLFETPGLTLRAVRDLITKNTGEIVVDTPEKHNLIKKYLSDNYLRKKIKITLHNQNQSLFEKYKIESELEEIFKKKVWLKSGGYLIIEETEGLTVIDINTGKYIGDSNQDKSLLKLNLEAAKEAARQIRLRNLVGIIVIDFIDIKDEDLRFKVYKAFKDALNNDRARTVIQEMSQFSVVQLTRQRTRESILNTLADTCNNCNGNGRVKSVETMSYEIIRKLNLKMNKLKSSIVTIETHENIINYILTSEKQNLSGLENKNNININFVVNNTLGNNYKFKNQ